MQEAGRQEALEGGSAEMQQCVQSFGTVVELEQPADLHKRLAGVGAAQR